MYLPYILLMPPLKVHHHLCLKILCMCENIYPPDSERLLCEYLVLYLSHYKGLYLSFLIYLNIYFFMSKENLLFTFKC